MTWVTNLKIAIAEKDVDRLSELMSDIPTIKEKEELEQAVYLLRSARELVYALKEEATVSMKQIKNSINFLKVTELKKPSKLDIKS